MSIIQGWNALTTGPIQSGPMVGEVGTTDARVWAQARTTAPLTLTVAGGHSYTVTPTAPFGCVHFHLTGLHPGTPYSFEITRAGDPSVAAGTLTTARAATARTLRLVFGSCFRQYWEEPPPAGPLTVFTAIANEHADLFVLAGDSVYFASAGNGDPTGLPVSGTDRDSEQAMVLAHLRTRNNPALRDLLRHQPTLAIWDDHDYGPNNADGTFAGRDQALAAFAEIWAQRSYGIAGTRGAFSRVRSGPAELFLLDDRYHRVKSPAAHPQILGADQLAWLQHALSDSTAPIKLVVSGSVVLPEFIGQPALSPGSWEGWRTDAPDERAALFAYIEDHGITGVVFLSGDLHTGYLYHRAGTALSGGRRGPEYWELTSSPLNNSIWARPVVDAPGAEQPFYDRGVYQEVRQENYGVVDIDLDRTGDELHLALRTTLGNTIFSQHVPLTALATRVPAHRLRAVGWVGDKAYFFRGERYVRYTIGNVGEIQHVDAGYPAAIAGRWPGFDRAIDAGTAAGGKAYLFRGNGYMRYSPDPQHPLGNASTWTPDPGYPTYIARNWHGFWRHDFDAAVAWPNGFLYVFRGTQYLRCAVGAHTAEDGYPRPIAGNWPGLAEAFPDGIDAAVVWSSTKAYFFRGDQYVRYHIGPAHEGVDPGYPRPIAQAWPDLVTL